MALSYLQHLYLLLVSIPSLSRAREREIDEWEERVGRRAPEAVREFYTAVMNIPMAPNETDRVVWNDVNDGQPAPIAGRVVEGEWEIALTDLWAEYWEGAMEPLSRVLDAMERAYAGEPSPEMEGIESPSDVRGPLVYIETDVMRSWHAFFELDGSADPPLHEHGAGHGWSEKRSFSSWLFKLFADAYVSEDWAPRSFWGQKADLARSEELAPVQPFRSGLWLRAAQGPLSADARAALAKELAHDQRPYAAATIDDFSSPGENGDGWIWVISDSQASVWWIHGKTEDHLLALARAAREVGRLEAPFVADTREGEAVRGRG